MASPKSDDWIKVGCGVVVAVGLLAVVIAATALSVQSCRHHSSLSELKPHLGQYLALEGGSQVRNPHIVSKVVVVSLGDKDFDDLAFNLPENLRATRPSEVGSVIQVAYSADLAGSYQGGDDAYRVTADVTVIDLDTGRVLASNSFVDDPPSTKLSSEGDQYGSGGDSLGEAAASMASEIADWLKRLPVQQPR